MNPVVIPVPTFYFPIPYSIHQRERGSDRKESACNAGDLGLIPGLGRSPEEGNGYPLQYSCLENPMDREPGGLQSMGSNRVGHDWATNTFTYAYMYVCIHMESLLQAISVLKSDTVSLTLSLLHLTHRWPTVNVGDGMVVRPELREQLIFSGPYIINSPKIFFTVTIRAYKGSLSQCAGCYFCNCLRLKNFQKWLTVFFSKCLWPTCCRFCISPITFHHLKSVNLSSLLLFQFIRKSSGIL